MSARKNLLSPAPGFSPEIGLALSAMEEVREQVRQIVREMPDTELVRRAFPNTHPIGALLLHLCESEWWWMQSVVSGRELTDEEKKLVHWDVLKDPSVLDSRASSGQYCLEVLDQVRERTREVLASFDDRDLERLFSYRRGDEQMEVSLRWVLHHLVDHEAQHKGQILLLKRMLAEGVMGMRKP